jgi:hypothetical protein
MGDTFAVGVANDSCLPWLDLRPACTVVNGWMVMNAAVRYPWSCEEERKCSDCDGNAVQDI